MSKSAWAGSVSAAQMLSTRNIVAFGAWLSDCGCASFAGQGGNQRYCCADCRAHPEAGRLRVRRDGYPWGGQNQLGYVRRTCLEAHQGLDSGQRLVGGWFSLFVARPPWKSTPSPIKTLKVNPSSETLFWGPKYFETCLHTVRLAVF